MTYDAPTPASRTEGPGRRRPRHLGRWIVAGGIALILIVAGGVAVTYNMGGFDDASAVAGPWHDDFDGAAGTAPDSKLWEFNVGGGGWGNNELQDYTRTNAVLDGSSHLAINATIDATASGAKRYRSSSLVTRQSFTYGTLEARIKLPDGQGLLPAFWLVGSNVERVGWPESGEIDVVETPDTTTKSFHNIHGPSTSDSSVAITANASRSHSQPLSAGWHTYAVTRAPNKIQILLDGKVVAGLTPKTMPEKMKWVFNSPFRALLSLAIGGDWPGSPNSSTRRTSTMLVDWVRYLPD